MNMVTWILFGALAGLVAHASDRSPVEGGMLGSIIIGVSGAILGGATATLLFQLNKTFDLPSFIIAISFSLFLVLIHHTLFVKRREL